MNKTVSVFCIWRDSKEFIERTLKQLESLEKINGYEFSYYFYENDSVDGTQDILSEWMSSRKGKFKSEKLNVRKFGRTTDPDRMKFLCMCRNKCKNLAEGNKTDYSLLIDSDIEFSTENFRILTEDLEALPKAVMVTSNCRQNIPDDYLGNTPDSYYDVYAFRDKRGTKGLFFSDCPSFNVDDQNLWRSGRPIITMSSFGGFALIKSDIFNSVFWSSDIHCDHVNMCYDISRHGIIYCDPRSKVFVDVDSSAIGEGQADRTWASQCSVLVYFLEFSQ